MAGPLEAVRVLDFTWALAGSYGAMILADLGAEVIKVERPTGDTSRAIWPKVDGVSTYFFSVNRGKKSIVLDLTKPEGKEIALRLVEISDIVTENFTPGTMDKLGLGYEVLKKRNPKIIYGALSGFGQTGPARNKPALDVIVQAMGGIMSITGPEDGEPVRVGASIGDLSGGVFLALGVLAALEERRRSGQGQALDLSMLDCQAAILENAMVRYFATGEIAERKSTRHQVSAIHQAFPTKDGYIAVVTTAGIEQWAKFLEIIGRLDILPEPKYHDRGSRARHIKELEPIIIEALKKRTTAEWVKDFESVGIACGPLNNVAQAAQDPQLNFRNMFIDLPCPGTSRGVMRVSNTPFRYSRTPAKLERGAPALGQYTDEVLSSLLHITAEEIAQLKTGGVITTQERES